MKFQDTYGQKAADVVAGEARLNMGIPFKQARKEEVWVLSGHSDWRVGPFRSQVISPHPRLHEALNLRSKKRSPLATARDYTCLLLLSR